MQLALMVFWYITLQFAICFLMDSLVELKRQVLEKAPKDWGKVPADKGRVWKLVDENGIERVRFMSPTEGGKFAHTDTGYWRLQDEQGRHLDEFGDVINPAADSYDNLTHIPYTGLR